MGRPGVSTHDGSMTTTAFAAPGATAPAASNKTPAKSPENTPAATASRTPVWAWSAMVSIALTWLIAPPVLFVRALTVVPWDRPATPVESHDAAVYLIASLVIAVVAPSAGLGIARLVGARIWSNLFCGALIVSLLGLMLLGSLLGR
jgi:hypothetical protein